MVVEFRDRYLHFSDLVWYVIEVSFKLFVPLWSGKTEVFTHEENIVVMFEKMSHFASHKAE